MKLQKRVLRALFVLFLLSGFLAPSSLLAKIYEKTADNFIVVYDGSSSMDKEYKNTDKTKLAWAKSAVKKLVDEIPSSLSYNAGIYKLAKLAPIDEMKAYNPSSFSKKVDALPEELPYGGLFSGNSPLGNGMRRLDKVLSNLSGRTVVYLVSDGENSDGFDPVSWAGQLHKKYNVCFSIISLADSKRGEKTLADIAALSKCSEVVAMDKMTDDVKLASSELFIAKAAPAIQPAEAYSAPDADEDGVADNTDKCKNTPMGYAVDGDGCQIREADVTKIALFDSGKSSLSKEDENELAGIANFLSAHPEAKIVISGHTDDVGTEGYNVNLSKKRATIVSQYLSDKYNVSKEQMVVEWHG